MRMLVLLSLILNLKACVHNPWQSEFHKDHPLVGKIYDSKAKRYLTVDELELRSLEADLLLFGEVHNNKDHHRIQARFLNSLLKKKKAGAFLLEHLIESQEDRLQEMSPKEVSIATGETIKWSQGWDDWTWYRGMIALWKEAEGRVVAASFPRKKAMQIVMSQEQDLISREESIDLGFSKAMNKGHRAKLVDIMKKSHCGHLPKSMEGGMIRVQRLKDAYMAKRVLANQKSDRLNILLAGNGHTRTDWGVPSYLKKGKAKLKAISISWREVDTERDNPEDYVERSPADYIWWTPVEDIRDPCEVYKESLKRMKTKGKGHRK